MDPVEGHDTAPEIMQAAEHSVRDGMISLFFLNKNYICTYFGIQGKFLEAYLPHLRTLSMGCGMRKCLLITFMYLGLVAT